MRQIKRGSFDADDDLKNADVLLPIEKVPDLVTQYGSCCASSAADEIDGIPSARI
jgi:hypothetical protein